MAELKVTSFEGAEKLFDGKYASELKIGNNTRITKNVPGTFDTDGEVYYGVTLHGHPIVNLYRDRVTFTLAGWPTVTTRDRVNQFLPAGTGVYQHKNVQYHDGEQISDHEWREWRIV